MRDADPLRGVAVVVANALAIASLVETHHAATALLPERIDQERIAFPPSLYHLPLICVHDDVFHFLSLSLYI